MANKKLVKSNSKKVQLKAENNKRLKPEILTGKSSSFSIEEAIKDALVNAQDLPSDYFKYEIIKMEFERGGIAQVHNLLVTLKRTVPK